MKNRTQDETVFLSLGSNMGACEQIISSCALSIQNIPGVFDVQTAHLYDTTPVQMQEASQNFVNSAVSLQTILEPQELKLALQHIEKDYGKVSKGKDAPRPLDIDIIFFGHRQLASAELTIPHLRWRERLFVLIPLSELTDEIFIPDTSTPGGLQRIHLPTLIATHANPHQERVERLVPRKIPLC